MKIRFVGIAVMVAAILILYFSLIEKDIVSASADTAEVADIPEVNKQSRASAISKGKSEISGLDSEDASNQLDYGECYKFDLQNSKKLSQEIEVYLNGLRHSSVKEDQLAYAIFAISFSSSDSKVQIEQERREALLDLDQNDNPLVALEKLRMCGLHTDNKRCDNALINELTTLHKDDSEIWLEALYYYLATEQDEQVFRAISEAQQSKYSSSLYSLFASQYAQTLEKANITTYNSAIISAIGYYMAKTKPYNLQTNWCKNNLQNAIYTQSCLEMGVLMEQRSSDTIDKLIGLAIQGIIYKAEGNAEMASLVDNKANSYSPNKRAASKNAGVINTIIHYEDLLRAYIENIGVLGEFDAIVQMEPEVLAFQKSVHYEDCGSIW